MTVAAALAVDAVGRARTGVQAPVTTRREITELATRLGLDLGRFGRS
jgi:hypothetical protein